MSKLFFPTFRENTGILLTCVKVKGDSRSSMTDDSCTCSCQKSQKFVFCRYFALEINSAILLLLSALLNLYNLYFAVLRCRFFLILVKLVIQFESGANCILRASVKRQIAITK